MHSRQRARVASVVVRVAARTPKLRPLISWNVVLRQISGILLLMALWLVLLPVAGTVSVSGSGLAVSIGDAHFWWTPVLRTLGILEAFFRFVTQLFTMPACAWWGSGVCPALVCSMAHLTALIASRLLPWCSIGAVRVHRCTTMVAPATSTSTSVTHSELYMQDLPLPRFVERRIRDMDLSSRCQGKETDK